MINYLTGKNIDHKELLEGHSEILLLNPKISEAELKLLQQVVRKAPRHADHIWISTSGSSVGAGDSVKVVAISRDALRNSAKAVNSLFDLENSPKWANALPLFHVGGLGVIFRAHLSKGEVLDLTTGSKWNASQFVRALEENGVNVCSLVPTQVFDLVAARHRCPCSVKVTFVGGGFLDNDLYLAAHDLGWPLYVCYGMTETGSQVATARDSLPEKAGGMMALPHAELKISSDGHIMIKCTSLLTSYAQLKNGSIECWSPLNEEGWFVTEDLGVIVGTIVEVKGRHSDFLKIGGENFDLGVLQKKISEIGLSFGLMPDDLVIVPTPNERLGVELYLACHFQNEIKAQQVLAAFNGQVLPLVKLKNVIGVEEIPKTELGKIQKTKLAEIIKTRNKE
jgi:o-succinylbenzoate---CoA ligase